MVGQKDGQYVFDSHFLPQNCILQKRSTDCALAGISERSLAAGR